MVELSVDLLCKALAERGWKRHSQRQLDTIPFEEMVRPDGSTWLTRRSNIDYPFTTAVTKQVCQNKAMTYDLAVQTGLAIPQTLQITHITDQGRHFLQQYKPVVVKPLDSFGSRGLTLDIVDEQVLEQAIYTAQAASDGTVLMQQQAKGIEYRLSVLDGVVISVIQRQPLGVTGDGNRTIEQLITQENQARQALPSSPLSYPAITPAMLQVDLDMLTTVPALNQYVQLSKSSMVSGGASLYEVVDKIDSSYKAVACRMAQALDARFVVVDVMIQSITTPATATNYVLIECNTSPNLKMYYAARNGKQCDIVNLLADAMVT